MTETPVYQQLDLLAYRAPVVLVPPEPLVLAPRQRTADELWKIWQLATSRLLVFHDRVSDGQVTMVARLVREFIAAGRGTDARYTVRLLREPHQFQVVTQGRHEEVCVAAGTALRIDYRLTSVAGFAIFRDQAGLTDLTAQRWAWLWERPKHIYIGG